MDHPHHPREPRPGPSPDLFLRRTLFDTPIISPLLRVLARWSLRLSGWRVEGEAPPDHRFVLIAVPHTSNWDLPVALCAAFVLRVKLYWMGKDSLFRPPFGGAVRWLGGIPIDRSKPGNVVSRSVELFRTASELILAIPPEGTRRRVSRWKTGFYYIALGAEVPIVLGFLDWGRRSVGLGPAFRPTGDLESDLREIQAFYVGMRGKNPEDFGPAA